MCCKNVKNFYRAIMSNCVPEMFGYAFTIVKGNFTIPSSFYFSNKINAVLTQVQNMICMKKML